jgi:ribosomal-protein-alanine N-acetyltransferase
MREADLAAVTALEQRCGLSPWGEAGYRKELSNPQAILLVAFADEGAEPGLDRRACAGFLAGWVVADEFQLHNLAVDEERRRCRIGSALLAAGLRAARGKGARQAVLEVRASNRAARALYEKHGFGCQGRRPGYYHDPPEDALVLVCRGGRWLAN